MSKLLVVLLIASVRGCYWNTPCPYQLFGSVTPYDAVRGDIRDHATPANCHAVSIWVLSRHGNRNPRNFALPIMKAAASLKDDIISSWKAGKSQLCAQDIEEFKNWHWHNPIDMTSAYLTRTGYKELFDIGMRIKAKYPYLLRGNAEQFYFRPTNEPRTAASCAAFANGITDGTDLNVTIDRFRSRDDVIRPYKTCDRYQDAGQSRRMVASQLNSFFLSSEYITIQTAVQQRLGIKQQLNASNVFAIYELCRYFRSWEPDHRSPWCSIFTEQDLKYLEYYDDIRQYYSNGFGPLVKKLGRMPLKNLYESFKEFLQGGGRKVTAYFSHVTMLEMAFSALGLYQNDTPLQALRMDPNRAWRTAFIGPFAVNIIAVLNSCNDPGSSTARVQLFINEKETPLCPIEGCSWYEFENIFKPFADANLDACKVHYKSNE